MPVHPSIQNIPMRSMGPMGNMGNMVPMMGGPTMMPQQQPIMLTQIPMQTNPTSMRPQIPVPHTLSVQNPADTEKNNELPSSMLQTSNLFSPNEFWNNSNLSGNLNDNLTGNEVVSNVTFSNNINPNNGTMIWQNSLNPEQITTPPIQSQDQQISPSDFQKEESELDQLPSHLKSDEISKHDLTQSIEASDFENDNFLMENTNDDLKEKIMETGNEHDRELSPEMLQG
ncbi:hypothetical protein HK096_001805, partial [Nowakowskiella sp. JEL0078]